MLDAPFSTIAQLVFADPQPLNFARVVGDLHTVLARFRGSSLRIEWDCEDIAMFDLPEARIVLGWNDQPGKGYSACLTVSVGPLPTAPPISVETNGHESMCSRLIERLQSRFPATAILWHQTDQPVSADLLDALVERLPALMELFPFQEPAWMADAITEPAASSAPPRHSKAEDITEPDPKSETAAQVRPEAPPPLPPREASPRPARHARARLRARIANDRPQLPRLRNSELSRIRAALYDPVEADLQQGNATQIRLASHAMNATLIMVWLPLGAAVMTYGLLKGDDIHLSARLMVATGTIIGLAQSPLGQTVAAMAGV
jgi:hypothetical protein